MSGEAAALCLKQLNQGLSHLLYLLPYYHRDSLNSKGIVIGPFSPDSEEHRPLNPPPESLIERAGAGPRISFSSRAPGDAVLWSETVLLKSQVKVEYIISVSIRPGNKDC